MSFKGGHQLLNSEGSQVQPGHTNLPPVEGRQAGLWPQLRQQGGGHHLLQCYALCPQCPQCSGWRCVFPQYKTHTHLRNGGCLLISFYYTTVSSTLFLSDKHSALLIHKTGLNMCDLTRRAKWLKWVQMSGHHGYVRLALPELSMNQQR